MFFVFQSRPFFLCLQANEENLGDVSCQDKDVSDHNHHLEEEESKTRAEDIQHLQIQEHQRSQEDVQQCQLRQLLDRTGVVPLTIQTSVANSNGVNNIIPQILQQMVPNSTPAVIQVQSTSNGTTYICSPEILETYRRMQAS